MSFKNKKYTSLSFMEMNTIRGGGLVKKAAEKYYVEVDCPSNMQDKNTKCYITNQVYDFYDSKSGAYHHSETHAD